MNAVPQPTLRQRAMTMRDLDAVVAVEAAAYGFPWSRGNFVDSLAAGYVAEVLETTEGELIGYFVALPGAGEMHLLNLTVAPPHQGRGHGSALLGSVRARTVARSFGTLWLEVRESNTGARTLYARRGFVEVGRRRGYYPAAGGREDAIVMSLAVDAGAAGGAAKAGGSRAGSGAGSPPRGAAR